MCVVSMVGDHYREKWRERDWYPWINPAPLGGINQRSEISKAEFDALKAEVEELKKLLVRAKEYDERNGEPECEIDEKMDLLRKVAKLVGIELDDVIGPKEEAANG